MSDWIEWPVEGWPGTVRYCQQALSGISDLMVAGYRACSWGGVEVGGILLGSAEANSFLISDFRPVECDHADGPSYELTAEDRANMRKEIDAALAQELKPVGWYKSVSNREVAVTDGDQSVWAELFPTGVFLILKRSKEGVAGGATFYRSERKIFKGHRTLDARELADHKSEPSPAENPPTPEPESPVPSTPNLAAAPQGLPKPGAVTPLVQEVMAPAPEDRGKGIGDESIQDPVQNALRAVRLSKPSGELPLMPPLESPASPGPASMLPESAATGACIPVDAFALTPDPDFFYPGPQYCEALANLEYSVKTHKGFVVLVGESGTGKTMVLECLSDRLNAEGIQYGFLFSSRFRTGEFFELLTMDFGLKPSSNSKTSILMALNQHLIERANSGRTTALLIDDAQKLTTEVLEEIELLSNLETRKQKLLQVVMAARPEFETRLDRPEHAGLRQRIVLRPRLGPLSSSETAAYIRVRLDRAGKIGLAPALPVTEIHRLSNGIPRLISTICGQLLELRGADDQISSSALQEVTKTIGLVN